jgi:hypothetical protein
MGSLTGSKSVFGRTKNERVVVSPRMVLVEVMNRRGNDGFFLTFKTFPEANVLLMEILDPETLAVTFAPTRLSLPVLVKLLPFLKTNDILVT